MAWNNSLSYASALTTEMNSLAAGSVAVAGTATDNSTTKDEYGFVSISFPTLATGTGAPFVGVYLLPLNEDGTTYGDGTSSGTTAPAASYWVVNIDFNASLSSGTQTGSTGPFPIPPTSFKLAIYNETGSALAASGNVAKFASASPA